ncbi:CHAT domain-containing protein [Micromonospora sp. NBC_01739]|uniref:CHAT domain-containing protein n=1 Tax=Micromonospora sp. NBC_01739 TaxID=2975985 RepID=UPI002E0DA0D9|nr:CHAT domain-containing protein [Micromonospora sp. NBC_01739]
MDREDLRPGVRARLLLDWYWLSAARGRRAEAAAGYQTVIELAAAEDLGELRSEALLEAGILARNDGRLPDAEELLVRAGEVAVQQEDWLRAGQVLAQRAAVAHQGYQFLPARERLAELAEVLGRCPPSDRTDQLRADLCHRVAVSARIARDFDLARESLVEARDRYAALGRRVGAANAERELGAVLDQVGDTTGARQAYERAFVQYLRAGRPLGAAHAARRLGQMRLLDVPEDPDAAGYARRRFEQALRLGDGEPGNRLGCEFFLARLDRLTGDLDAAEARLAALPYDDFPNPRDLSQVALEWAMVSLDRGDRASAIDLLNQAVLPLDADRDPSAASIAHYHLAYQLILDDQVEAARDHSVIAFTLAEKAGRRLAAPDDRENFYQDQRQTYILAMHCAARAGDGRTAFAVATAARAEAVSAFVQTGARLSEDLRELVDAIVLAGDSPELPELYRRLDRAATAELRRAVTPQPAGLAETVAALPPGGHALILDVLEDETTICNRVWLPPDGTPRVDEVRLSDELRAWLDRYHAAEPGTAAVAQEAELAALGEAIIPPGLAQVLAAGGQPPLVVSTGGLLGPVPVAAVRVGSRYLAELARIVVVPAITLWTSLRARPTRTGVSFRAYLDPDLPGTQREETLLKEAFPQAQLLCRRDVRPTLAEADGLGGMLLSVHGTATSGLGQALLLAPDDPLTAAELLTCRLPEAVLMPACWAARLDLRGAQEPFGLPIAALLAGARWVLAGTVEVSGTRTATLLGAVYRRLAAGLAPVDALRGAQLDYLRRYPNAPVALWAGLTIVGDGFTPATLEAAEPLDAGPGCSGS